MYVFNRSLCLCGENGLTGSPSGIWGCAGRLVRWSRQETWGSETRVKQWRWRNMHGFRVMSGDSCNKCGGGMMDSPGPSAPGLSPYSPALRYFFLVIYTSVGLSQPPEEGWSGGWGAHQTLLST